MKTIIAAAAIVLAVVGAIGFFVANAAHVEHPTACRVTDKDRTKSSDGSSDARVYTDNCGTFQVGDSLFEGHWSSADTFASIDPGETYDFKTRGWRVPFLSMFPNIVRVEGATR